MTDTMYALYPVFLADPEARSVFADPDDRARVTREVEDLVKRLQDRVTLRGSYSTVGFRADADLMLWLVGQTAEDVQQALVEFRRTEIGTYLDLTWTFMGVVKPAEFSPDHQPAFVKGDPPQDYLCVYPFVRTRRVVPAARRGARRAAARARRQRPGVPRGGRQHDERLRARRLGVDPRVRVAEARLDRRRDPAAPQHRGAPLHEGRGARS